VQYAAGPTRIGVRGGSSGDKELQKDPRFYKAKGTGFEFTTRWALQGEGKKCDGWIMQKVVIAYPVEDATGNQPPLSYDKDRAEVNPRQRVYWELWRVKGGEVYTDRDAARKGDTDVFRLNHQLKGTRSVKGAALAVEGEAIFVDKVDLTKGDFSTVKVKAAVDLYATESEPDEWKAWVRDGKRGSVKHYLRVEYDFTTAEGQKKGAAVDYSPRR
jgi:hypothetical protein